MRCLAVSPEATFDFSVAWPRARLLGVAIAEAEWASVPAGLAIAPHADEPARTGATIAGGAAGDALPSRPPRHARRRSHADAHADIEVPR